MYILALKKSKHQNHEEVRECRYGDIPASFFRIMWVRLERLL